MGNSNIVLLYPYAPAALPPGKRPGTHCIGGWVGPRTGLDKCGKSHTHRDSVPGPSEWLVIACSFLLRSCAFPVIGLFPVVSAR
jgi:hypothetical protein